MTGNYRYFRQPMNSPLKIAVAKKHLRKVDIPIWSVSGFYKMSDIDCYEIGSFYK